MCVDSKVSAGFMAIDLGLIIEVTTPLSLKDLWIFDARSRFGRSKAKRVPIPLTFVTSLFFWRDLIASFPVCFTLVNRSFSLITF